jgi:hypothetical protein
VQIRGLHRLFPGNLCGNQILCLRGMGNGCSKRRTGVKFIGSIMTANVIRKPKLDHADKLKRLYEYLTSIRNENFTGYIKVNFTQGNVGRVEKFEEILKK